MFLYFESYDVILGELIHMVAFSANDGEQWKIELPYSERDGN